VFSELLASLPIGGVFVLFALLALPFYEIGYVLGRWYQNRTPEETEGPTGMIVGSILALTAFLLAITMSMATERYDAHRSLVMEEANAIGTSWLRAGYLPEPAAAQSRDLLAEYTPLRIAPDNEEAAEVHIAASNEILNELWAIAEELARDDPSSPMLALHIDSLNDTIDVSAVRANAGIHVRVPEAVLLMLFAGSLLSFSMVGLSAGLTGRRSLLTAAAMIVVLGAVITLIVDIDQSQSGTLTVNQGPLLQLA
jgi:hypothetical protein